MARAELSFEDGAAAGAGTAVERRPYAVAARELLRTTLLDCARDELQRRPWTQISMADVAHAAGVSRQTLYNAFGSRAEFAQAYVLREVDRFLAAVAEVVEEHLDDPSAALSAALAMFLNSAAEDPFVRAVLADDGSQGLLPLLTTNAQLTIERAVEGLGEIIHSGWPQVPADDADTLAELLVRLGISYAGLPTSPSGITAASLARVLEPFIAQVLAEAAEGAAYLQA